MKYSILDNIDFLMSILKYQILIKEEHFPGDYATYLKTKKDEVILLKDIKEEVIKILEECKNGKKL